jgi:hypothetical protein
MKQLCNNAGVYPITRQMISVFGEEHFRALEIVDILSVWAKPMAWVESIYGLRNEVSLVGGDASFPWPEPRDGVSLQSWGMSLDGKKVLVASPFENTIREQEKLLSKVFKGIDIPKMRLELIKVPMSQGGLNDGKSYEYHLAKLKDEMAAREFDVALVSAGAYSLPLAAHAKMLGKRGVHAGGALQTFFGISGKRYDSYPWVLKFKNSHWKRPSLQERPENWRSIEDGCYW